MTISERICERCGLEESTHSLSSSHFFQRKYRVNLVKTEEPKKMEVLNPKANRMLIVDLGTKKVGIQFRHLATKTLVQGHEAHTRLTHCGIFEIPKVETDSIVKLAFGVAKCSKKDNFSKEKGRKCSLTRALLEGESEFSQQTQEAKDLRGKIWEAYRNRGESSKVPSNDNGVPALEGIVVNAQKLLSESTEVSVIVH